MPENKGEVLLAIARAAIAETLELPHVSIEELARHNNWLQEQAACFVTLMKNGQLRGCIGTLEAHRTLLEDVIHNANAAAFRDTRFSPLTSEELADTEIEVSLLSPMQVLHFSDEQEALTQLRPNIDGVLFEYGQHRGTFLPQVWQQLPERNDFIAHLKNKAGLASDFWSDQVKLYRYTVDKWKESDFITQHKTAL
jgi:AmmeMemoRadiSam system protein A